MTALVLAALAFLFAWAIYIAVLAGRRTSVAAFLDAGSTLPPWVLMFAGAGVALGGLPLHDHFLLSSLYGLPYSQIALGLTLMALCGAMAHNRLWLAARLTGFASPIEIFSAYYGGVTIRIVLIGISLLFAAPFAAQSLDAAGRLVAGGTNGLLSREQAVFVIAVFLFLVSALGGWRAVAMVVASQVALLIALLVFVLLFMASSFGSLAMLTHGPSAMSGALADQIPRVIQYSAGIGKDVQAGGPWSAVALVSTAASLIGLSLSPAMGLLVTTSRNRSGLAFQQVWMVAGLAAGLVLIAAPLIGAEIAAMDPLGVAAASPKYWGLINRVVGLEPLAALCFLVLLLASLQLTVTFFVSSAACLFASDVVHRYLLPDLSEEGRRLAARIVMAILFAAVALLAGFAPIGSAITGSVALSLAAQLLPAAIGLGFAPWISRSAVVTGLLFGGLMVLFTEPPGLIAFEGLFLDLPWGRWPLTIHSTAWGLILNVSACLIVSLFTRSGPEREHRERLHTAFREALPAGNGRSRSSTAKWSLTLIWTYLALGPGAVIGNTFFSKPMFAQGDATLGAPSLWAWQIVFWLIGVMLVWWLAYQGRMSTKDAVAFRRLDLSPPAEPLARRRTPEWLALLIARVAER